MLNPRNGIMTDRLSHCHNDGSKSGSEQEEDWKRPSKWMFAVALGLTAISLSHLWYRKSLLAEEKTGVRKPDNGSR